LIVVGAGVILFTNKLGAILIFSQVGNGIWLPVVVIFILLLVNRRDLMGEHVNSLAFNIVAWVTAVVMIALTLVLCYTAFLPQGPGAAP
jgi:Mn2+/Fe2+ NRAMP family transporter